jgi:hypothetical protein
MESPKMTAGVLSLDALPVNGKLHVRDHEPRREVEGYRDGNDNGGGDGPGDARGERKSARGVG